MNNSGTHGELISPLPGPTRTLSVTESKSKKMVNAGAPPTMAVLI